MTPDPALGEIGRQLAQARRDRQLSMEDVSRRTKIAVPFLAAIERGDMQSLPAFYVRGFLRAMAHETGCDAEAIVLRFREATGDREIELKELVENRERAHPSAPAPPFEPKRRWLAQTAGLVVLVGASWFVASGMEMPRLPKSRPPARASVTAVATPPRPAAAQPTATPRAPAPVATTGATKPAALTLDVEPRQECWLSAIADGERVVYQLLNAGERARIEAREDLQLRIGDAGAFAFVLNGQPGKSLGATGEAVNVHVTSQNYREFLGP